jgi:hypothetical protein
MTCECNHDKYLHGDSRQCKLCECKSYRLRLTKDDVCWLLGWGRYAQ